MLRLQRTEKLILHPLQTCWVLLLKCLQPCKWVPKPLSSARHCKYELLGAKVLHILSVLVTLGDDVTRVPHISHLHHLDSQKKTLETWMDLGDEILQGGCKSGDMRNTFARPPWLTNALVFTREKLWMMLHVLLCPIYQICNKAFATEKENASKIIQSIRGYDLQGLRGDTDVESFAKSLR